MSNFEKATRLKLRFDSSKGMLTVEDLWDLPLTSNTGRPNLDQIAIDLHKQLKNDANVSFVDTARKSDETVQLSFDVVKHVIDTKMEENKAAKGEKERAEKKQHLLALINDKENEALKGKSIEELRAEIEKL